MEEHFNVLEAKEAQRNFCKENNVPMFAPTYCPRCFKGIYHEMSVEQAGKTHITSCPCCNYSFVE